MVDLLPQLSRTRPSWDTSAPLGLHRYICAYLPSVCRSHSQEISSIEPSQIGDNWNFSVAELEGGAKLRHSVRVSIFILQYLDFPEVTGTASIFPTSTSKAPQSVTSSISSSSSSHHSSNVGATAGGVVGGIVGAALIAGVVLWFAFRRRHARLVSQGREKEQPLSLPLTNGAPKFYVGVYSFIILFATDRVSPRTLRIQRLTRAKIACHRKNSPSALLNRHSRATADTAVCQRSEEIGHLPPFP